VGETDFGNTKITPTEALRERIRGRERETGTKSVATRRGAFSSVRTRTPTRPDATELRSRRIVTEESYPYATPRGRGDYTRAKLAIVCAPHRARLRARFDLFEPIDRKRAPTEESRLNSRFDEPRARRFSRTTRRKRAAIDLRIDASRDQSSTTPLFFSLPPPDCPGVRGYSQ